MFSTWSKLQICESTIVLILNPQYVDVGDLYSTPCLPSQDSLLNDKTEADTQLALHTECITPFDFFFWPVKCIKTKKYSANNGGKI